MGFDGVQPNNLLCVQQGKKKKKRNGSRVSRPSLGLAENLAHIQVWAYTRGWTAIEAHSNES